MEILDFDEDHKEIELDQSIIDDIHDKFIGAAQALHACLYERSSKFRRVMVPECTA